MDIRENRKSLAWGVTGLCLYLGAAIGLPLASGKPSLTPWMLGAVALGVLLLIKGLAHYARAKGRSSWWGLLGFLNLLGLIALMCLEDRNRADEDREFDPNSPALKRINTPAIASFWCGIISIIPLLGWPIGAIGVGLGVWALVRIRRDPNFGGRGRAICGIALPFIWIALTLVAVFIGIERDRRERERRESVARIRAAGEAAKNEKDTGKQLEQVDTLADVMMKESHKGSGVDAVVNRVFADWLRQVKQRREAYDRALGAWNAAGEEPAGLTSVDAVASRERLARELARTSRGLAEMFKEDLDQVRAQMLREGVPVERANGEITAARSAPDAIRAVRLRESDERISLAHADRLAVLREFWDQVSFDVEQDMWIFAEDSPPEALERFQDAVRRINAEIEDNSDNSPQSTEQPAKSP